MNLPPFRTKDVVVEGESGPSDVQCQECKLLMLPIEAVNFVEFVGPGGQARVSGGKESWRCFKCWREVVVRWHRASTQSRGSQP